MKMTIPYSITGKQRKQLAEDISVALHTIPKYLGYPTCNYQIGDCVLERDGKLIIPDCVADTATALLEHLRIRGYQRLTNCLELASRQRAHQLCCADKLLQKHVEILANHENISVDNFMDKYSKIIDGVGYDTKKTIFLGQVSSGFSKEDIRWSVTELYRTRSGMYFLHGSGGLIYTIIWTYLLFFISITNPY